MPKPTALEGSSHSHAWATKVKHVEAPISVASSTHSVRSDPDDMSDKLALNQTLCSSLEPRALSASTSASVHHSHGHNYSYLHPHRHGIDMPRPQHAPASSVHGGNKCGIGKTMGNIFVSFVGAGVLALPYAFSQSGIILGSVFMVAVALLALYCIFLLVDCKRALEGKGVATYSEVVEACMGLWGKRLVEVLLILSQAGFCTAYFVFMGTNLQGVSHLGKVAIISMIVPLEVALAMLKDLTALAPFALAADAAIILGMLVVIGDDFAAFKDHAPVVMSKGMHAIPFLFGVVIYCYEGIGMILPLEDSMRDKSKFKSTLAISFVSITAVFISFGVIGYLAYGDKTNAAITMNLPEGWTTYAVQVSLSIGLMFTFPVMMVPVYEIADRALDATVWWEKNLSPLKQGLLRRLARCCTIVLLGIIASTVCNFAVFISFIGSFACSSLAFIIPASCHIILFKSKISSLAIAMDILLIGFGVVGMLFGINDSFKKLGEGSGC